MRESSPPLVAATATDPPAARSNAPRKGEWNHAEGFLGIPECGKSALMTRRALELSAQTPSYIIAHDAERQAKDRLPPPLGGWPTRLARFDTVAQADAWLTREGARACGRVVAVSCLDAVEVVAFANKVAARSLATTRGGEGPAPPVVCMVDEVANCDEMGANYLGPTLKAALTMRRHRHTALLWGTQTPHLVHRQFLSMSTQLYVFRLEDEPALRRLETQSPIRQEALQLVKQLKQFQYIRVAPEGFKAPV